MKIRILLILLSSFFIFTSCLTVKDVKYIKDSSLTNKSEMYTHPSTPYLIQTNDYLYLKVLSLDPKTYSFFNGDPTDYQNVTDMKVYLTSYLVNDSGNIDLPMVGKVYIKGLTIEQARLKIQGLINEYINQATIILKLTSFKITVLGEVNKPGKYSILNEQINIFEALGLAGDITDYGNKGKVTLMRQLDKGTQVVTLDLSSKEILTSEYFNLKPSDVLYVEPLRAKSYGARAFTFGTMLTALSTVITLLIYIQK